MFRQKWGSKYRNVKQDYNGILYQSKKEAGYAAELDLRLKAKDIKSWARQECIRLDVNGFHIANYYIDFVITHNDDSLEYVEVKGYETDVWKMKWKIFEALYSGKENTRLTIVK